MKRLLIILIPIFPLIISAQNNGDTVGVLRVWGSETRVVMNKDSMKYFIGLPNVSNTSPNNLPVSIATASRINDSSASLRASINAINAGAATWGTITGILANQSDLNDVLNAKLASNGNGGSLTGLTKTQVGLPNVDNTSDASKPISTAQQSAFDTKQPTLVSGINIKTVNGTTLLGSGDMVISGAGPTFINLTSNFSSTSTTEAAVTGWSFSVTSGKTYRIEIIAGYQTSATTTGGELGFFLSASAVGTVRGFIQADVVNTAAATGLKIPVRVCTTADATGSFLISTGVTAIDTPQSFYAILTFTCTTSGTFNVGWATEVAASAAQLNANSSLIYQALN